VRFSSYARGETDRQTNRHTHHNTSQPYQGEVIKEYSMSAKLVCVCVCVCVCVEGRGMGREGKVKGNGVCSRNFELC